MAKMIHIMIRVFAIDKALTFYANAFELKVSDRFDFDDFSLVYLRNAENDIELELTYNRDRAKPYTHGDGYGHIAFAVENLVQKHSKMQKLGYEPGEIKEFWYGKTLLAKFFFIKDPDGYDIEVLEKFGRYT